jgi:hypothetical protein
VWACSDLLQRFFESIREFARSGLEQRQISSFPVQVETGWSDKIGNLLIRVFGSFDICTPMLTESWCLTDCACCSEVHVPAARFSSEHASTSRESFPVRMKSEVPQRVTKFYAVRQGYTRGLFYSWADCEREVKGYSGAEFKSFKSKNEALRYLGNKA